MNASRKAPRPVTAHTTSTGTAIGQRPAAANGIPTANQINTCIVKIGTLDHRAATAAASVSRPTRVNRWGAVRVTREGYPVPDG
jgi:hypothetical protein